MIDPVELAKAKEILEQNIFDIAIEKKYKTNITEISLAVDFYFEWLKRLEQESFIYIWKLSINALVKVIEKPFVEKEKVSEWMKWWHWCFRNILAEKNRIKYKLDIKGNLKFAKTIFEKKETTKPTKKEISKLGDGFEEDSEELPSIDDYFNNKWILRRKDVFNLAW